VSDWTEPRVAVVTGGASGIGLAIGERLASDGAAVAIFDLDGEAADAAAAGIEAKGGRAIGLEVDVTDRPRIEGAVAEVAERFGPPLILVNNAGRPSFVRFLDITLDHWHERIDVNLTGTFHCCQVVLPHMLEAGWGRIVNISSSSTHSGTPRMAAYVAAKSAVVGLTKCLALEFGPKGVTVNTIPPGFIDTPMTRDAEAAGNLDMEVATKMTPVRRPGQPEDIAAACSFLCREEAGYITGQTIGVNGGRNT
jgi:2-hydroxycyclohexanecarboxyl-CoA dehydrogenase